MVPVHCTFHGESALSNDHDFASVADRASLTRLLGNILSSKTLGAEVRKDSYWHHNGFTALDLSAAISGRHRTRLHMWCGEGASNSRIHSHPWDFASRVLTGTLVAEYFVLDACGVERAEFSCLSLEERRGYSYEYRRNVHLQLMLSVDVPQGGAYELRHNALHRVTVRGPQPLLTLVAIGPYINRETRVYYELDARPPTHSPNNYFSEDAFYREVEKVLSCL